MRFWGPGRREGDAELGKGGEDKCGLMMKGKSGGGGERGERRWGSEVGGSGGERGNGERGEGEE